VNKPNEIELENYDYFLPEEKIAQFPLKNRDHSKLLVYNHKQISHHIFSEIPDLLPAKSLLIFNETRVIPARLQFRKSTGAIIEILLLNPVNPGPDVQLSMNAIKSNVWNCLVKNFRRWHDHQILEMKIPGNTEMVLRAEIKDRRKNFIGFSWAPDSQTFSEILEAAGKVPLPPYMKREVVPEDRERYQTVYSRNNGAVAAPTAGLHFTDQTIRNIKKHGHNIDFLTLHVGAGTFQPIRIKNIRQHPMHSEQIMLSRNNIRTLMHHPNRIIAVGTTSMRTLESLYWFGVKLLTRQDEKFIIEKLFPYSFQYQDLPTMNESLGKIFHYMQEKDIEYLTGDTGIFILPGYSFKICKGLITNYHIPKSTLILLVAAFIGEYWKDVYSEALDNNYRFLSYGDSSLLLP
jgi:S-adenosylmethionine:tRNA ribosyltransferase-isomerase